MIYFSRVPPHNDPLLPLDWRAQAAERLAGSDHGELSDWQDPCVVEYAQFLRKWRSGPGKTHRRQIASQCSHLLAAQQLWCGNAWRRLEAEARLLAGQPINAIAKAVSITAEAITAYERLFFSISDRLLAADYILTQAIRRPAPAGIPKGLRAFMLSVAYFAGLLAFEETLVAIGPMGASLHKLSDLSTAEGRCTEQVRLAAQACMLPMHPGSGLSLTRALPFLVSDRATEAYMSWPPDVSRLVAASAPHITLDIAALTPSRRTNPEASRYVA